ncbi:MAG: antibiotic biosynthesis monooxygenase family protein [Ktedonobacteraceae bacterium]
MELLVITLVQTNQAREAEAMAHIRLIADSVRNAPGLLNARFYRGKEPDNAYFILTTWESSEWWHKTQERHDPRMLLLNAPVGIFLAPPDQWLMQYIWGYSRPLAQPVVVAAHLALVRADQVALVQQSWLESLRQQAIEPILAFALLARTIEEAAGDSTRTPSQPLQAPELQRRPAGQRPMFLNLLIWPSETYQADFYANEHYRYIQGLLNNAGFVRVLKLDPL